MKPSENLIEITIDTTNDEGKGHVISYYTPKMGSYRDTMGVLYHILQFAEGNYKHETLETTLNQAVLLIPNNYGFERTSFFLKVDNKSYLCRLNHGSDINKIYDLIKIHNL